MFVNNKSVLFVLFFAAVFLFACEMRPDALPLEVVSEVDGKAMV